LLSYDLETKQFFFDKVMYSSSHKAGINSAVRLVFKTEKNESTLILSFGHFVYVKEERNGTLLHHEVEKVQVGQFLIGLKGILETSTPLLHSGESESLFEVLAVDTISIREEDLIDLKTFSDRIVA
jgi:hypothetical protein